jgi:hypothetical protein
MDKTQKLFAVFCSLILTALACARTALTTKITRLPAGVSAATSVSLFNQFSKAPQHIRDGVEHVSGEDGGFGADFFGGKQARLSMDPGTGYG